MVTDNYAPSLQNITQMRVSVAILKVFEALFTEKRLDLEALAKRIFGEFEDDERVSSEVIVAALSASSLGMTVVQSPDDKRYESLPAAHPTAQQFALICAIFQTLCFVLEHLQATRVQVSFQPGGMFITVMDPQKRIVLTDEGLNEPHRIFHSIVCLEKSGYRKWDWYIEHGTGSGGSDRLYIAFPY